LCSALCLKNKGNFFWLLCNKTSYLKKRLSGTVYIMHILYFYLFFCHSSYIYPTGCLLYSLIYILKFRQRNSAFFTGLHKTAQNNWSIKNTIMKKASKTIIKLAWNKSGILRIRKFSPKHKFVIPMLEPTYKLVVL